MARTLIKNGTVVSPTGRHRVDVLIEGDTISALLEPGQVDALNISADKVIDATGKFVVPGGIDVHTHMELPFGGTKRSGHGREKGLLALEELSSCKTLVHYHG